MYTTKKSILSGMVRMYKNLTPYNSTYPKVAVQWFNQKLCFYQCLCLVDSEVLRNRHLRVAANRYRQAQDGRQLCNKPTKEED
jgi:hypothetical protein